MKRERESGILNQKLNYTVGGYNNCERGASVRKLNYFLINCAALILFLASAVFAGQIEFHVINVGQGDAMFFKMPAGEIVLIDGGAVNAGERVVSYLKRSGVKRIDLLIATHPHEDHIGGLISVLGSFPVSAVWDPGFNLGTATQRRFLESVERSKAKFEIASAGFYRRMGDAEIRVIAPVNSNSTQKGSANSNSIIAHVSWKNISFLLMADAEHRNRNMIESYPRSTVLKISHHGSRNGTTRPLLQRVDPRVAVVSYAENNSYGHPHEEALQLLEEFNIALYSTPNGNIVLKSDGESYSVIYDNMDGRSLIDRIKSILDIFFRW